MTDNNPAGQRGPAEHERRDQILELANELFSAHGYRKTSVTDIAKAVGSPAPTCTASSIPSRQSAKRCAP